jgi:PadR family transcriptional regulator, regulatory protein PadR
MENDLQRFLPLSEQVCFILLSLAPEPKHGYAISKEIQVLSQGRVVLSVSTLYTLLKRLLDDGLIERSEDQAIIDETGRPRKVYQLTDLGQSVLSVDLARLRSILAVAELRFGEEKA